MNFLADATDVTNVLGGVAFAALLALIFLTGLVWCGAVQLVRIARSLQKIADALEKKEQG
jgi:hypothetical protein